METRSEGRVFVQFNVQPLQDEKASKEAGRPVFKDTEFIRIVVPGDKQNIVHRPVNPDDPEKYRDAYQAFKRGVSDAVSGTPLAEWPLVTRSQVEELGYFGVRSVEQLANVSDGNLKNMGPYIALRQ